MQNIKKWEKIGVQSWQILKKMNNTRENTLPYFEKW